MTNIRRPSKATSPKMKDKYQPKHIYNLKFDKTPAHSKKLMVEHNEKLPEKIDLRDRCTPVRNQQSIGACSSFALCGAYDFDELALKHDFISSPLFLYYQERSRDHNTQDDSGSTLTNGIEVLTSLGVCSEASWPYIPNKFTFKPNAKACKEAHDHKIKKFTRIDNSLQNIKKALVKYQKPITCGILVYPSFETEEVAKTGEVPMPDSEEIVLGGHACLIVGFNDSTRRFTLKNSWGEVWGEKGYFTLSYDFITNENLCSDMWQIIELDETSEQKSVQPNDSYSFWSYLGYK